MLGWGPVNRIYLYNHWLKLELIFCFLSGELSKGHQSNYSFDLSTSWVFVNDVAETLLVRILSIYLIMSTKTTHFEMVITSPVTQSDANSKDISKKEREVDDIVHSKKISSPTSLKHRIIRICTILQRTSAPFISVFATVHLTAPIAANFGGSQLSTSTMVS
jgi:hypothetical protein